jgi:hypothetical protein
MDRGLDEIIADNVRIIHRNPVQLLYALGLTTHSSFSAAVALAIGAMAAVQLVAVAAAIVKRLPETE